jgi:exosortase/archaeosortase family protein
MTTIDNLSPSQGLGTVEQQQHSFAPEKTQGRLLTPSRLAFPAVLVLVGLVAQQWYRKTEATTAAGLANILGAHNIKSTGTPRLLVLPKTGSPFYALVSFGCSSLSVLLTFAVVALVVIRSSFRRRLLAAVIAVSILFVVNVGRVAGVAAVGSHYGLQTMSRVHDWFGTAVTLLGSVLAAGCVYLIAAMPAKRADHTGRSNRSGVKVVA